MDFAYLTSCAVVSITPYFECRLDGMNRVSLSYDFIDVLCINCSSCSWYFVLFYLLLALLLLLLASGELEAVLCEYSLKFCSFCFLKTLLKELIDAPDPWENEEREKHVESFH